MNYRILSSCEINQAIDCFSRAIARDWPNTEKEARSWVEDEFNNPYSIIFGTFAKNELVGTCSLVPINFILKKTKKEEIKLVLNALRNIETDLKKTIYIGGLGVEKKWEGKRVASGLFTFAENFAINKGYKVLVGHTAVPNDKYSKIKSLSLALSKFKMKKLPLIKKVFYSSPNDLEKVWLYKSI